MTLSNSVHLWTLALDPSPEAVETAYGMLSADERERADRLARVPVRDRFVLARSGLRRLLAQYLDTDPATPSFSYTEHGKPYLEDSDLSFNLSHSGDLAAYAVAAGRSVGVDVEFLGRRVSREQVAKRFFASEECAALESAAEGDRDRVFFSIWTLKEAYLKARGQGISVPLDGFAVRPEGANSLLLRQDGDPEAGERWKLVAVNLESEYVAAVCADGRDWQLERLSWRPR